MHWQSPLWILACRKCLKLHEFHCYTLRILFRLPWKVSKGQKLLLRSQLILCSFRDIRTLLISVTHPKPTLAATPSQHLLQSFFCRSAEHVAPELIGCLLVKRQLSGELLWGVIVETEAYSQDDPACHGYRRRTPSNETLFGEPGRFYVQTIV